jgi:hypothetical protein
VSKKHHVDFVATKEVKKPTEVAFTTKDGTHVDFVAKKPAETKVEVSFMANNKKK